MAKQLNVNLSFTADTSQAAAQVQNLQRSLTQLVNQPVGIGEKLSADMLKATHAAAELKMHLQNATNVNTGTLDFSKLNQSLKSSGVSLQQYATQLQSLGPQGQQAFMQLARSVANAEVPLRRSNALLTQFGTTLANTARWQLSSSLLHGFIGAVSSAWNYSQDLNESLNNIRIVTGKNIEEMSRFADQANRAAKALSTTTTEYTNASLIYYQQGLSDSEVLGRTETTIKMANASRQSAEIVSDQMTAIWNNFYDGSRSLEYYADVVTALGAATASSSEEIAQGLEKFAAVADTVGLSYEYATAALATVTATTRQSADVVGTAFKTLFARLSDLKLGETLEDGTTLGSYSENLAKIGVNIKDASGALKDMDTILNETAAKWDNLDKAQQVALAKGVAGIRQYTQFIALMDNWDFMEENLGTVAGSGGTLEKQAKTYEESWEAASKRVKASLETIYASIMDDEFFIDLTDGFADLISHVGGFVKSIGGLQGVLSGLGWILTKVFAEQMTQGFQNLYYNIQMSSQAGRQAMQDLKMQQMQSFADSMVSPEGGSQVDLTRQQVYKDELLMQQQLMDKADQLTAAEQNKYKVLIEQHRVMGEQSIELAKQLELTKDKMANSSTELLGTGLNNGIGMKDAMGAVGYARESAQSMASVEQVLQKINSTSKVTTAQIDQLQQEFYSLGASDDVVMEISNALWNASGNADQMEEACVGVKARLSQLTGDIPKIVAELLGIKPGAEGFAELAQKVAQYMGHAKQAKIETDNLKISTDNGKASVDRFGESLAGAGQKAQSAAQLLSTAVSGLMSMGMLISSISGLIDTIKDPDASGWEKFGRILTSVSMIAMSVMGTFTGLKAAYELLSSGIIKNTLITTANSVANSINEKHQRKNNITKGAGVTVGKKANQTTREGTVATYQSTIALRKENAEKRKSIGYDKLRGKKVKKPTVNKTPKLEKGTLKTLGRAAGRWGAAAAAVAIVATTITLATESYNKHNKAAKEAAEQAKEAATAYGQVSDAYSDFTSKLNAYDEAQKGLKDLTKGTDEYRDAVLKANDATIELLKKYEDLHYTVNEDGLIILDDATRTLVQKREQQRVKDAQMANLSAQQNARNKQLEADSINFQRDKLKSDNGSDTGEAFLNAGVAGVAGAGAAALATFALVNAWNPAGWAALIVGGIAAIVGGVVTASVGRANEEESRALELLSQEYEKNGNARFADADSFKSLLSDLNITDKKLIDSLVENRTATLALVKEMAVNNSRRDNAATNQIFGDYENVIKSYGLNSEQAKDVSAIIGASMDERVNSLYEKTYKDKGHLGGGMTDAEVQKAYAEAMGWATDTIENQSGNKAKYYNKDGSEVGVISDEVARRYLAEKAAYKDLEQVVRNVTKTFVKLMNSANAYDNAMADFLTSGNFSTMTKTEFNALQTQVGGSDGVVDADEAKQYIDDTFAYGEELTDEEAQAYGFSSAQAFYDSFLAGFKSYEEDRAEVLGNISTTAQTELSEAGFNLDDLSNTTLKQVGSVIDQSIAQLGDGAGAFMAHIFSISKDQAGELAVALDGIDWASATPDSVAEALQLAGIAANYTEDELNGLIHVMQAGFVQTIDDINKKIVILEKMSKLKQGDSIDAEQYSQLSAEAQSYFTVMADGTYKLTKDAQDFYNVVNREAKKVRLEGLEEDIQNSVQTKNSIQYSKDTLSKGTSNNYGITTYDQYVANTFADTNIAGSVSVKDGKLVMPFMTKQDGNLWGKPAIGLTSTNATLAAKRNRDAGGIWGINVQTGATDNGNGTTTYSWGEATDFGTPFMFANSHATIKEWGNKYSKTVYTNEADYTAQAMKGTVDAAAHDQAAKQVEYLKSTSFGLDKANAATIKAWEDAIAAGKLTGEAASKIAETTTTYLSEYEGLVAKDKELLDHIGSLAFQHLSETESAAELESEYERLLGMAETELQKEKIKEGYTGSAMAAIAEEKNEGLDPAAVDSYSDHLMKAAEASDLLDASMSENTEEAKEIADEVARYTMKMNKGVEKLANGFEEWNSVLTESNEASEEYHKAMTDIKDAMSDVLGVDEQFLTDSFIKDNLPLIEKAAKGSAEAIDELAEKAAQSILLDVGVENGQLKEDLLALEADMKKLIPDDIKVGATLDSGEFIGEAQELIDAAGMTVQEAQAYFNSLGYEPEFVTEEKEIDQRSPITVTETADAGTRVETLEDGTQLTWVKTRTTTYNDGYTTQKGKMDVVALGSNGKTPQIKSLTKKSSGAMNNYSGANKGGKSGGGGGSKPEKNKKSKKSDVVERYKEINDQIDDTREAMEKAKLAAEGLWGAARIKKMREVQAEMKKELQLMRQRRAEAAAHLEEDRQALQQAAAENGVASFIFDNKGNITNYDEIMNGLWAELKAAEDAAGDTLDDKEKERIQAIKDRIEAIKEAIGIYDDTRENMEDWDKEIDEWIRSIQEAYLEELNLELEMKVMIDDSQLAKIEYYLGKVSEDIWSMAESAALMTGQGKDLFNFDLGQAEVWIGKFDDFKKRYDDLLYAYTHIDPETGETFINQEQFVKALAELQSDIYANLNNINELDKTMIGYYGETLAAAGEELAKFTDLMDHHVDVLDHYASLLEIMGKSKDWERMKTILSAQVEVAKNSADVSKANYEMLQRQAEDKKAAWEAAKNDDTLSDYEKSVIEKQWLDAQNAANEAQSKMLEDAQAWAEALKSLLETELEELGENLEKALAGDFGSLDYMMTSMERANSLQEEYLTTTNKIYETNKLMRSAQQEIDKSTNSVAKRRMAQFIEETQQLQNQNKLSQYELEIQQAKYDLLLAEIALEEAQAAKSTVRLQRDSEGNFGYVYTADQNEVANAQQELEDAQNALYNIGLEGANKYAEQYAQTIQEMNDEIRDLTEQWQNGEIASKEEYQAKMLDLEAYYGEKLMQFSDLHSKAIMTDSRVANEAWTKDFATMTAKTQLWMQQVDVYVQGVEASFSRYQQGIDEVEKYAGMDLDSLAQKTEEIKNDNDALRDSITDPDNGLIKAMEDEINKVGELALAYAEWRKEIQGAIADQEDLARLIGGDVEKESDDDESNDYKPEEETPSTEEPPEETPPAETPSENTTPSYKTGTLTWKGSGGSRVWTDSAGKTYTAGSTEGKAIQDAFDRAYSRNGGYKGDYWLGWNKLDADVLHAKYGLSTGGYTGNWAGSFGKLAFLHQKELVLNKQDTENLLTAMEFLNRIISAIDLQSMNNSLGGLLSSPSLGRVGDEGGILEQQVHIEASFPGITEHSELEQAFNNLINEAAQYANRK